MDGRTDGQTDRRTDGWTDGWKKQRIEPAFIIIVNGQTDGRKKQRIEPGALAKNRDALKSSHHNITINLILSLRGILIAMSQ